MQLEKYIGSFKNKWVDTCHDRDRLVGRYMVKWVGIFLMCKQVKEQ